MPQIQERKQQMRHLRWGGGWTGEFSGIDMLIDVATREQGGIHQSVSLSLYIYNVIMHHVDISISRPKSRQFHAGLVTPAAKAVRQYLTGSAWDDATRGVQCTERNMSRCRNVWTVWNVESEKRWDVGKVSPPISE